MLVCVTFLSFFISMEAILARMTLLIVCAFTMVVHAAVMTSRLTLPDVPYYTGLDVWTTVNFAFLFLAIIEFALCAGFPRKQMYPAMEQGNGVPAQVEEVSIRKRNQKWIQRDSIRWSACLWS